LARACGPSKPIFATTAYEADARGVLRAVLPSRCVFAPAAELCSLFVDHYRARKTGPRFPVAVVGCSAHRLGRYTLYPPGHYPYGREAVAPCSASGPLLLDGESGGVPWEATLFAAAVDAASGEGWPSDSPASDSRRRRTQGRRLDVAGRLVGVHPVLDATARERIATRLRVPAMTLLTAARGWGRSWKLGGAAILAVLVAIPLEASLLDRILAAGAVSGVWPEPRRWDVARRSWVMARSSSSEHPVVRSPRGRGPPPTNSPDAEPAPGAPWSGS
jgi:hypothetical protein